MIKPRRLCAGEIVEGSLVTSVLPGVYDGSMMRFSAKGILEEVPVWLV